MNKLVSVILGLVSLGAASVMAHTPYVLPNAFSTSKGKQVTAVASFTEKYFVPDFKIESDDFHLILPDGTEADYKNVGVFAQLTILESDLETEGTYRLSTGDRLGRKFKMMKLEDGWDYVRRGMGEHSPETEVPEGVQVEEFQSQTVAVAYVSKGAPTQEALEQKGTGLEIVPLTHPSEIYLDDGFEFQLTFNGEAVGKHEVKVYREGGSYEDPEYEKIATTNKKGKVLLSFDEPGVYLLMTRHQDLAPEGSETPYRSYTISLTFEVQR
ncbi:DUF4198 domain-containing protein [Puniceicoccaceae bacterium K14]|nr:DUF4198 domain-containing protein [Puniceicoccaceae bacterium K14]